MKKRLRIFALGGNEVSPTGKVDSNTGKLIIPDLPEQWRRTAETLKLLAKIIKEDPDDYYVITHGNGPQVGNILLRAEYSQPILHLLPLDVCDADTQGAMGYMLAQLTNDLRILGINRIAAETITRVVVNEDDPEYLNPSKYIGPSYIKEDALTKRERQGYEMKFYKLNEKGEEIWRRVVPSPKPADIVEIEIIDANMRAGIIPIAVGGGGVPVKKVKPQLINGEEVYRCNYNIIYKREFNSSLLPIEIYTGVEAVVDKDLATSLLGKMLIQKAKERNEELDAELIIFTDIDSVKLNFQKPGQRDIRKASLQEMKRLLEANTFPPGSMAPKIEAAINFIEAEGRRVYITKAPLFYETLSCNAGTLIEA